MSNLLYVASQSAARHLLLRQAEIPFVVVRTSANEEDAVVSGTVIEQVRALAQYKHDGIDVEAINDRYQPSKERPLFFLTADTLIAGEEDARIYGKPCSREHAKEMLLALSTQSIRVATGMCLSVWHCVEGEWRQVVCDVWHADALAQFHVPAHEVEAYLDACSAAMYACGATVVEGIGIRYFSSINGSYTGTLGIDLFTLYQKLEKYHF